VNTTSIVHCRALEFPEMVPPNVPLGVVAAGRGAGAGAGAAGAGDTGAGAAAWPLGHRNDRAEIVLPLGKRDQADVTAGASDLLPQILDLGVVDGAEERARLHRCRFGRETNAGAIVVRRGRHSGEQEDHQRGHGDHEHERGRLHPASGLCGFHPGMIGTSVAGREAGPGTTQGDDERRRIAAY
jgi:hypothetical protein